MLSATAKRLLENLDKGQAGAAMAGPRRLSIRHVGPTAARSLATEFGSLEAIEAADEEQLAATDGVRAILSVDHAAGSRSVYHGIVTEWRAAGVSHGRRKRDRNDRRTGGKHDRRHRLPLVDFSRDGAKGGDPSRGGGGVGLGVRLRPTMSSSGNFNAGSRPTKAEQPGVPILGRTGFKRPPLATEQALDAGEAGGSVRPTG